MSYDHWSAQIDMDVARTHDRASPVATVEARRGSSSAKLERMKKGEDDRIGCKSGSDVFATPLS